MTIYLDEQQEYFDGGQGTMVPSPMKETLKTYGRGLAAAVAAATVAYTIKFLSDGFMADELTVYYDEEPD